MQPLLGIYNVPLANYCKTLLYLRSEKKTLKRLFNKEALIDTKNYFDEKRTAYYHTHAISGFNKIYDTKTLECP